MDRRLIKQIAETIRQADRHKTHAYDTAATVVRVEGGTAWVHIPGGVAETPVRMTVDAKAGDTVQVRVSNGRAHLTGNATAPPTDNTLAEKVRGGLKATDKVVKAVKDTAEKAKQIATSTAQYFWVSTGGTDNGAHITAIPQNEFEADPQNGGGNTLMTSNGVAVRDGLTELAQFGATGCRIGTDDYIQIDSNGLTLGAYGVEKANLRYGDYPANDTVRLSTDFALRLDSEKEESTDSVEFVKTSAAARTVPSGSATPGSNAELICESQHSAVGTESYYAECNLQAEAGDVSAGVEAEAVCDDVSDPTQNYSVLRLSGDLIKVNRNAPIVKDTFSDLNKSANTYYYQKTFNVAKSGYTPIAFNPYTNHATEAACMVNYNSSAGDATVTVMSRNNTISGLNLYLDVTYARNELL